MGPSQFLRSPNSRVTKYSSTNCSISSEIGSKTFEDIYKLGEILGDVSIPINFQGKSSVVKKCHMINDSKLFAVKIMRTDDEEKINAAKMEFKIMNKLHHPNIV
jgi:hypothetical protein